MRRTIRILAAPIVLQALGGCATLPDFLGDSATYNTNPNAPIGASVNMQRVRGVDAGIEPLRAEPGNVWPSEIQKVPTLQELEKETNTNGAPAAPPPDLTPFLPGHSQPRPAPGSSGYAAPPALSAAPAVTGGQAASRERVQQPGLPSPTVPINGAAPAPVTSDGAGYKSIKTPQGNAILVPNGNGTSTLIKPDGSIQTVPGGQ